MKTHLVNPEDGIYKATPDYIHAIKVEDPTCILFVSGTMGLDANGDAPPALDEQLRLIWQNIRCILAEAGMTTDNIVRLTSYLASREHAEKNSEARLAALGDRRIPTTAIVVTTLDPSWLVEIEVIAVA